jgi:S-formylglutathione hydrolase FrmB
MPVEILHHTSAILEKNPLGDPHVRELAIYLPPSYATDQERRYPTITVLSGYGGIGLQLLNRDGWLEPLDKRFDRLIREGKAKEAIVILPDCFTKYGGSQYIDSPAVGSYETYVAEELIHFVDARYRTIPKRDARAVIGKSSGGYGAMILAMHRPDVFGAFGSHAGDCAFDLCYAHEFPRTMLMFEKHGGVHGFLQHFDRLPSKPEDAAEGMSQVLAAACWSPWRKGPYGYGVGFDFPYDLHTCRRIDHVWQRWMEWDPVALLDRDQILDHMRRMRAIYLDGGRTDEYHLQLGARQVSAKLQRAGIAHVHEEFEGGHFNVQYRYDRSLEVISKALLHAA